MGGSHEELHSAWATMLRFLERPIWQLDSYAFAICALPSAVTGGNQSTFHFARQQRCSRRVHDHARTYPVLAAAIRALVQ